MSSKRLWQKYELYKIFYKGQNNLDLHSCNITGGALRVPITVAAMKRRPNKLSPGWKIDWLFEVSGSAPVSSIWPSESHWLCLSQRFVGSDWSTNLKCYLGTVASLKLSRMAVTKSSPTLEERCTDECRGVNGVVRIDQNVWPIFHHNSWIMLRSKWCNLGTDWSSTHAVTT